MSETGIFIRVGKEDVLLENLNVIERTLWLEGLSEKGLINTVNICCDVIEDFIVNYQDVARKVKELEEEVHRLRMYKTMAHTHYGSQKCDETPQKSTEKCDEKGAKSTEKCDELADIIVTINRRSEKLKDWLEEELGKIRCGLFPQDMETTIRVFTTSNTLKSVLSKIEELENGNSEDI